MKIKLSKTQQECINHLKENDTFLHYMSYMGRFRPYPYYFASKTMKHFREVTVRKLIKVGLLKKVEEKGYDKHKVFIKE